MTEWHEPSDCPVASIGHRRWELRQRLDVEEAKLEDEYRDCPWWLWPLVRIERRWNMYVINQMRRQLDESEERMRRDIETYVVRPIIDRHRRHHD